MINPDIIQKTLDKSNCYPFSPEYEYKTELEIINLDEEKRRDIASNNGFIIFEQKEIKKSIKDDNGIFSKRYGQTITDMNPFADRYKCHCGEMTSRVHEGLICPKCQSKVKFVDDNFEYFGWIETKLKYSIIHPNLFKNIEYLIGADKLDNIIKPYVEIDKDGNAVEFDKPKDEPYFGIGLIEFKKRFREIIDFYYTKNKHEHYIHIVKEINKVFINSIPVFTTHLRPYRIEDDTMYYGDTNTFYRMMARLAYTINKDDLEFYRKDKPKMQLMYDIQIQYKGLYDEIVNILEGKKGTVRTLFGGRMNFTSRDVIVPDPRLRSDEVTLPYKALVELLQQSIINILQKQENKSYNEAYQIWYKASLTRNNLVFEIIKTMIRNHPSGRGIPILINRNPTISYGGILQMYVKDVTDTYTMRIPLVVCKKLGADFDGDVLNILYIINQEFYYWANKVFNPRNSMYISRNDGMFDNSMNHARDTMVNMNTFVRLSRNKYTPEMIEKIKKLKSAA